jgi:hypothetical protein
MRSVVVLLALVSALLSGCELIADFDRSKLVTDAGAAGDGGGSDGGNPPVEDAAMPDASVDDPDAATGDEDAGL